MSQSDVYEFLKNKRLSGNDSYFNCKEIMKALNGKGISINLASVNHNLASLRMFGFLDIRLDVKKEKRITTPFVVYRVKKECLV